ncbi:TPA: dATP/dGTP pyrophosphohydrolase domain-containing protein [Burkholderia cenocepacia]|nr:dATP/dGTP pyrophosphohydrolase domain-containing protein [Burkholderia cenocepacia]
MKTIINELHDELRAAHIIIRNALGVATFDQKLQWANANERDDVIGEGVTRAHERQIAIKRGFVIAMLDELKYADRIIANAEALLSPHQRELWFTASLQDGVSISPENPLRAIDRRNLLNRIEKIGLSALLAARAPTDDGSCVVGVDLGHFGGDEAAVVLRPPTGELARRDMDRLRRAFAQPGNLRVMLMSPEFDMHAFLRRQRAFSERTFGPGRLTARVCDHIRKELSEVEAAPDDLREWVDVILLGLDGAWRTGATPEQITVALSAKLTTNERRTWPDWRTCDPDRAIEHLEPVPDTHS